MKYIWLLLLLPSCSTPPVQHARYDLSHLPSLTRLKGPQEQAWKWTFEKVLADCDLNKDKFCDLRDIAELQLNFGKTK